MCQKNQYFIILLQKYRIVNTFFLRNHPNVVKAVKRKPFSSVQTANKELVQTAQVGSKRKQMSPNNAGMRQPIKRQRIDSTFKKKAEKPAVGYKIFRYYFDNTLWKIY